MYVIIDLVVSDYAAGVCTSIFNKSEPECNVHIHYAGNCEDLAMHLNNGRDAVAMIYFLERIGFDSSRFDIQKLEVSTNAS